VQPRPLPRVVLLGPAVAAVVARVEVQGLMVLLLLLLAALLGHLGRHLQVGSSWAVGGFILAGSGGILLAVL